MTSRAEPVKPARYVEDFVDALLTGAIITALQVALDAPIKVIVLTGLLWPVAYFWGQRIRRRRRQRHEVAP